MGHLRESFLPQLAGSVGARNRPKSYLFAWCSTCIVLMVKDRHLHQQKATAPTAATLVHFPAERLSCKFQTLSCLMLGLVSPNLLLSSEYVAKMSVSRPSIPAGGPAAFLFAGLPDSTPPATKSQTGDLFISCTRAVVTDLCRFPCHRCGFVAQDGRVVESGKHGELLSLGERSSGACLLSCVLTFFWLAPLLLFSFAFSSADPGGWPAHPASALQFC